ncbi:hypothetical protein BDA96_07G106500 [Sorghum bicolor]|uniref:EF-hand domain-containing protein n=1 Tax=Sorghum bicolor TaxID=4558 RepID=A0A921QMM2_SORBI|nr:hypothetical protein BDA96_07G106500 [Sorghum bicolor]
MAIKSMTVAPTTTRSLDADMTWTSSRSGCGGSTRTGTGASAARSCGAPCAPSAPGHGVEEQARISYADTDGDGYIDDSEVDGLIEFAQKNLGLKIVAY